jgi:predicted AAA+ superfamily ATPase
MELASRFLGLPRGSFFLFGPRGTGKTTWLAATLPAALRIDLLAPDQYRTMEARPERLREIVEARPEATDIVIDEVQRVPELLNVIHALIERKHGRRFVLTGSSARKLRRGGVNLLGGRALLRTMHPFMAAEWDPFDLPSALRLGMLPLVRTADDPEGTLRTYAALYLEQEVKAEGMVRNLGQFARFLETVSFSHASVLNVSNVARETEAERKTVAGFLEILEDLLLAFRLEVFTRRAKRKTATHEKFYLFDTGVFRSLRPAGPLDRSEEIEGAALEGLVAQHLRAWIAYGDADLDLRTWRTRSGVEVDFVVYGEAGFWAIEVKNTRNVRPEDLRGLRAFREDYPEAQPLLLHRGERRTMVERTPCIPVDEFLRTLRPGREPGGP